MVASRIRLDQLLLGKTYWNKNVRKPNEKAMAEDLASNLFGKSFQDKLRYKLHKNNPEYRCPVCNKSGQHTGVIVDESDKTFQAFVAEIQNLALYAATEDSINILRKAGFQLPDNTVHLSKKNKALAGSTLIFKAVLAKNNKVKAYLKEKSPKPNTGYKKDPQEVARLTQKIADNVNSTYYKFLKPCPVCGGNGYLDIGHASFVGKQSDILMEVFLTRIKSTASPKWDGTISRAKLEKIFMGLKVAPEIPKTMSRVGIENLHKQGILDLKDIAPLVTNQLQVKIDIAAEVKRNVYSTTQAYYETGTHVSVGLVTYQQVTDFFNRLIRTVRVKTRTLKSKLEEQRRSIQKSAITHGGYDAPYLSSMIVIDGATVHEALMRSGNTTTKAGGARSTSLYVYAERFVDKMAWNKGQTVHGIEQAVFGSDILNQGFKVKYFPQRVN